MIKFLRSLRWQSSLTATLACGVAGITIGLFVADFATASPSVIIEAPTEQVITADQPCRCLNLLYDVNRLHECIAHTTRALWRWQDDKTFGRIQQILFLQDTGTAFAEPGARRVVLTIPLPHGIASGPWYFRATTTEQCGLFPALAPIRIRIYPDTLVVLPPQDDQPG